MKYFGCFLVFLCCSSLSAIAQQQVISFDVFDQLYLRKNSSFLSSIKIDDVYSAEGDWSIISSSIGLSPNCETDAVLGISDCSFSEQGIEISFSDYTGEFELASIEISTTNFDFYYGGLAIKIGDPISRVAQRFSEAYNLRRLVPSSNGKEGIAQLELAGTDTSITFVYDTSTNQIKLIRVFTPIT